MSSDLEYGRTLLYERVEAIVMRLRLSRARLQRFFLTLAAAFAAFIVSWAYKTAPTASDMLFTAAERVYKPFEYSLEIHAPVRAYEYPTPHSYLNEQLQLKNLADFSTHVRSQLGEKTCIHATYYNVPYAIIVWQNLTAVNPTIVETAQHFRSEFVRGPLGDERWVSHPSSMRLRYMRGDTLTWAESLMTGHDALCAHYYMH
jgi:hypothetical protein